MNTSVGIVRKPSFVWLLLSLLIAAIGVYGMYQVFLHGQEASYGVSREVPWGLLIIGYAFFVALSIGTSFLGALAHVFKISALHAMSKKVAMVSLASLIGAFYLIFWELAGPYDLQALRLVVYFTEFEITSPIWWMVTFYMMELPLLALEVYFLVSKKENSAFYASIVGFFLGIIAYGTLAFVFASNPTRVLWHTSSFSLFFILSAIAGGSAVLLVMLWLDRQTHRIQTLSALGKLLFILLFAMLFVDVWNLLINLYGVDNALTETMRLFTGSGPLAFNFYFFEITAGILLPMGLLALGRFENASYGLIAGLLAIVGLFFARYDTIVAGQLLFRPSSDVAFTLAHYTPSLAELTLFVSGFGVALLVYFLGAQLFDLEEEAHA